jgi:hypothetical protein
MRALKTAIHLLPCLSLGLAWGAVPEGSPYSTPQSPFYGQVRPRTEFDGRALADTSTNKNLFYTLLRTRLGFVAVPNPNVEVKVEIQDSRFFGQEPTAGVNPASATIGNFEHVDLMQGYAALEIGDFKTAMGRQKMQLGTGRFISTLEWNNVSRAFDGISANMKFFGGDGNLTAMSFLIKDTNTVWTKDHDVLSGLYYSHAFTSDIGAEAYVFYDQNRLPQVYSAATSLNYDFFYYGERTYGKLAIFAWDEEFIWQGGEFTAASGKSFDSKAWQLGTRAGVVLGANHKINAGLDIMSGEDTTDNETQLYRANYFFGHALYGWMDYLDVNPRFGVMDWRLDADLPLFPNATGNPRVTLKPQYHFFTPQSAPSGMDDAYGQEIDFEAHLTFFPKSNIVLGAGLFFPGDGAFRMAGGGTPGASPINQPATRLTANSVTQNGVYLWFMPTFNF